MIFNLDKELKGKPFYAMEGKPYCEDDYLVWVLCEKTMNNLITFSSFDDFIWL